MDPKPEREPEQRPEREPPMAFTTGDDVEVCPDDEGFGGAYFAATVVRSIPKVGRYTVSYHALLSSHATDSGGNPAALRETLEGRLLRPRPPPSHHSDRFRLHDCVDAFYGDAWWSGVVQSVAVGSQGAEVGVSFPLHREVTPFKPSLLRPHLEWLSARWIPPSLLPLPASFFEEGAKVEVAQVTEGLVTAWLPAAVTKRIWKDNYVVVYCRGDGDGNADVKRTGEEEIVDLQHLRPLPCRITSVVAFCVNDAVEASYQGGWWPGTVCEVLEGPVRKYAVRLVDSKKDMEFEQLHLRPSFDWVNGSWLPTTSQKNSGANWKFRTGMCVEASSDEEGFKGAWFAATIIRPVVTRFCVEYHKLKTDDETAFLRETIDPVHIRPVPPETHSGSDTLRVLEEVDAYCNDGWWTGVVSKVLGKNRYVVYFRQWKEEMEFQHDELRPHYDWVGGRWIRASPALEL